MSLWRACVPVRLHACAARCAYDDAPVTVRNGAAVAQKVQTLFIDDLDGSAVEGTVRFGLDGTEYEIDLNAEHAQQLRDALAAYVRAGRRVSGGYRPARGGRRGPASGLNTTEVREWLKDIHGHGVRRVGHNVLTCERSGNARNRWIGPGEGVPSLGDALGAAGSGSAVNHR
jgi:Lsr2